MQVADRCDGKTNPYTQEQLMKTLTTAVLTALTACVAIVPSLAHARDAHDPAAVTVRYTDLNLATDAGNATLYARLESAARKVCAPSDIRDLGQMAAASTCQHQAIARAVQNVNSPKLAAVYAARVRQG
jgi:UrcA family protein